MLASTTKPCARPFGSMRDAVRPVREKGGIWHRDKVVEKVRDWISQ